MSRHTISAEALTDLLRRLGTFPPRSPERRHMIQATAALYGVSEPTLYRLLRQPRQPRAVGRSDRGVPRVLPTTTLERYLELIAAVKLRTSNRQGRHVSTAEAIRLLENYGLETHEGLVQAPKGLLKTSTVNAYLKQWGLDWRTLQREPPAVRFQAQHSNELWQFDISPSDLKQLKAPAWIDASRGQPTLMLYSVVDDRSGVAYQEYHCTYGEAVEAALQFLFNAMAPKADERFPFGGRPRYLYLDNGPVVRSHVFQQVMGYLDIEVRTHLPSGHDGRRTTARAKGKVERPFRTVKEAHETLYHFHEPQSETEANAWLFNYLLCYNDRRIAQSRIRGWRTGGSICRQKGCGRCAVGSGFAPLHANPSAARWGPMPRSASPACGTKSTPIWRAKRSSCGSASTTISSMSSMASAATGPMRPVVARFPCITTAVSRKRVPNSAPTALRDWRHTWRCRVPR
jgi:Integrase core domain